jgi:MFS family permease
MDSLRRNLWVGIAHETLWGLGFAMMDPVTVLQLALKDLGGSAASAGLLGGLLFAGMSLTQLPAAFWLHPRWSDPSRVARLHLPALACTGGLALLFSLGLPPERLLGPYMALTAAFFLFIGPVVPFWITMISRCVPDDIRGRYFGWAFGLANLGGIASGGLAVRWIGAGGLDWGYGRTFAAALTLQLLSVCLLPLLRPREPQGEEPGALGPWLRAQSGELLRNRPFRLFLAVSVLMQLASAPYNLYTDWFKQQGLPTSWWTALNAAKALGGLAGAGLMGLLADRRGPRSSLALGFTLMALSLAALFVPGRPASLLAFFGASFFGMAYPVLNLYMLMRLAAAGQTTALSGTFAAATAPIVLGAPFLSGWIAEHLNFHSAYLLSLLACALGLAFLGRHPDFGRAKPA